MPATELGYHNTVQACSGTTSQEVKSCLCQDMHSEALTVTSCAPQQPFMKSKLAAKGQLALKRLQNPDMQYRLGRFALQDAGHVTSILLALETHFCI